MLEGFIDTISGIAPQEEPVSQEKLPELEFAYIDPRIEGENKSVFECTATTQEEADLKYKEKFGKNPDENYILAQGVDEN
jgi:hypothetical protein